MPIKAFLPTVVAAAFLATALQETAAMTCSDAVAVISKGLGDQCPKVCKDDRSDPLDSGERYCNAGETSRSPSVCGATIAPECGRELTELSKIDMDELIAGLESCTGDLAGYREYAKYGSGYMVQAVRDIQQKCGYDESILDPKFLPTSATEKAVVVLVTTFGLKNADGTAVKYDASKTAFNAAVVAKVEKDIKATGVDEDDFVVNIGAEARRSRRAAGDLEVSIGYFSATAQAKVRTAKTFDSYAPTVAGVSYTATAVATVNKTPTSASGAASVSVVAAAASAVVAAVAVLAF